VVFFQARNALKTVFGRGIAPDPNGRFYDTPKTHSQLGKGSPLWGRGHPFPSPGPVRLQCLVRHIPPLFLAIHHWVIVYTACPVMAWEDHQEGGLMQDFLWWVFILKVCKVQVSPYSSASTKQRVKAALRPISTTTGCSADDVTAVLDVWPCCRRVVCLVEHRWVFLSF